MRFGFLKSTFGLAVACSFFGVCNAHAVETPATTQPSTAPASPATTAAVAVNWDEAGKHVGETVTVTGPVVGTHVITGGKKIVLNIGKDFPDKGRFSVLVTLGGNDKDPEATYADKTVTVTGKIEMYKESPEMKVPAAEVKVSAAPSAVPI